MGKSDGPVFDGDGEVVTGGEVEVVGSSAVGVAGNAGLPAEVERFLASAAAAVDVSDEDAELSIIGEILAGKTVDEILAAPEVEHLKELVGRAVWVHAFRWAKSAIAGSVGFYMMLTVSDEVDGPRRLVSCGSKAIMAQVFALDGGGFLPVQVEVHKADKPTAAGFYPMRLLAVEGAF